MKTFYCWIVLLLLYGTTAMPLLARETGPGAVGRITGYVLDSASGTPLEFVNIYLDSTTLGTRSYSDGEFSLENIPPGRYTLVVDCIGYGRYRERILVEEAGEPLQRRIRLKPEDIPGAAVLITAALKEQTVQMAPASVYTLKAEELTVRPITTFDEAVEAVPGVGVFRSTGNSIQGLSIRGSSDVAGGGVGNRVLLLIDGRPALTPDTGGAFWSLVPTGFIERVEVVKGAFSSLYGSNAMGGVVNIITRRPSLNPQTSLKYTYGFYEKPAADIAFNNSLATQNQIEFSHSGSAGKFSYLMNGNRVESAGHSEHGAFDFYDLYGKLVIDMTPSQTVEVAVGGGQGKNDYPHTWLNADEPLRVRDKFKDDRQIKNQFNADVHFKGILGTNRKFSSRLYYYQTLAESFFNENDPDLQIPANEDFGFKTTIHGDKLGAINQYDWMINTSNYLITGIDLQYDQVVSTPDSIMYGNHEVGNVALYAQHEWQSSKNIIVTAGLRYDYNKLSGGKAINQLSPKIATVYIPQPDFSLRLLVGQAFRAPTIAERFFRREIAGGINFEPNPDLDAEKMVVSLETGFRWTYGRHLDVDFSLFRYQYEDMIFYVDISEQNPGGGALFQVRNLNSAIIQGVEATVGWRWKKHLTSSINYTFLNARDRSPGRSDDLLPYKPEHRLNSSALVSVNRYRWGVDLRYRSELKEVALYPTSKPAAYVVVNSKVMAEVSNLLGLSVAVKNLFNVQYEELARYRMPGRTWLFTTNFTFKER